jgi:hypothetical protein
MQRITLAILFEGLAFSSPVFIGLFFYQWKNNKQFLSVESEIDSFAG